MPKKAAHQPSKLNADTHKIIVVALQAGMYKQAAADLAGIGISTLHRWLETGEADAEHDRSSPERDLWEAIKKADAEHQMNALLQIDQAARDGNWQAAAWRLERKYPQLWGRLQRVEMDVGGELTTNVTVDIVPDDDRRAEVARIAAAADGDG